jgi:hypothetical protein
MKLVLQQIASNLQDGILNKYYFISSSELNSQQNTQPFVICCGFISCGSPYDNHSEFSESLKLAYFQGTYASTQT